MTTPTEREALIATLRKAAEMNGSHHHQADWQRIAQHKAADMLVADAQQVAVPFPFFHSGVKITRKGHASGLLLHLTKWMRREGHGDAQTLELVAAYVDALEATEPVQQVAVPQGECWPEDVMQQRDYWRKEIAEGDRSSAPRDWFESLAELLATESQQVAVSQGGAVRYCYECGSIGEVSEGKRDCCPDGSHAKYVHPVIAEQAQGGLNAMLSTAPQPPQAEREPMTEAEIRAWWESENGLEDCDMCNLADFEKVIRAVESRYGVGVKP